MAVTLDTLLAASPFLAELSASHGPWLTAALADPAGALAALLAEAQAVAETALDEAAIGSALRLSKRKLALLAAAAETSGAWSTAQSTTALSDFADAAIEAALTVLVRQAVARGDLASGATTQKSGLAIFALGKHGGRELNYSSDIDIVAFFDPAAAAAARPDEATRVLTRVVQRLAALLEEREGRDYVFRTDLRLRPDPGSTPLALSMDAALAYYESRGQNWERAAWIKARPCAGDKAAGKAFLTDLAPYVWRRHLDFANIADIQAMKRQINVAKHVGEARVEGHNVKLGRGGIREIEFFAQTQQLIAGGRDIALRVRPTAEALAALGQAGWITSKAVAELTGAYWFLRAVENRLQMLNDEQTHVMPESEAGVAVIAGLMDLPLAGFEARYRSSLATVQGYYAQLFREGESLGAVGGNLVFTGSDDDPGTLDTLTRLGFRDAHMVSATVRKWHYGGYRATRAAAARAHLTELLPSLLTTIARTGDPDLALARFDDFLERLPSGVQLFALLRTHSELSGLLVQLLASAPRMAEAVIHRSHVMDGLIDPAFADEISRPQVLVRKVGSFLAEARDYQEVIDRARIIGQEQQFLIAAGLLSATMTARGAGEQFTALAETLLHSLFAAVRHAFEERHGIVPGASSALLAFGKMASREMTATSDLDFILLYDVEGGAEESKGARPLPVSQYYTRLTQRLVAALTAPTSEGVLYQADMRLRPSGNAGPLATTLSAFRRYQQEEAWTWEHLALTRARVVETSEGFGERIAAAIEEALGKPQAPGKIVDDVVTMRALVAKERPPRHPFDLKLRGGGLIDLEFIAQSAQLLARTQIDLPQAPTADVLVRLGQLGLVPEGARLAEIHGVYSTILQAMSAALVEPFADEAWTRPFRELLTQLCNVPDYERLKDDIEAMTGEVKAAATRWYERAKGL